MIDFAATDTSSLIRSMPLIALFATHIEAATRSNRRLGQVASFTHVSPMYHMVVPRRSQTFDEDSPRLVIKAGTMSTVGSRRMQSTMAALSSPAPQHGKEPPQHMI